MKTSIMFATLLIGLSPFSAAHAQDATSSRIFRKADTNGDGVISKDEALVARQHLFSRLDRNGDGAIDRDELEGARDAIMARAEASEARLGNAMRRLDTNGDGRISADEAAFIRNLVTDHHG